MFYGAIALTVLGNVVYHILQKSIPTGVNPMVSLLATYLVAGVTSLLLIPFFPLQTDLANEFRKISWPSFALGIVIICLELGFLLAYRQGWTISLTSLVANTTVALILIPVGLLLFKDHLTPLNIVGAVLALAGLVLVNLK